MGGHLFKCGTCLTVWSKGGRFFGGEISLIMCVSCLSRRALGFSVLRFWLFFRSVFGFCAKKLRFLGFGVHCGLRIFRFLAFGFRFSRKILMGFQIFIFDLFGFQFLFDLSGNYAPPLISNSSQTQMLSRRMRDKPLKYPRDP